MKYEKSIDLHDVSFFRYNDSIILLSPKGGVILEIPKNKIDFQYQIKKNLLQIKKTILSESKLESILNGFKVFYYKKLSLVGIGFRSWCYFDKTKNCQVLLIKVGLSKDVLVMIPANVIVLCLKPTLILIKGIDKEAVSLLACQIRSIKVPDAYKGKGIRYENEIINIKPGKQK